MFSNKSRTVRINHSSSAPRPTPFSLAPRALLATSLAFALVACSSSSNGGGTGGAGSGGKSSAGGSSGSTAKGGSGGTGFGGNNAGGSGSGGSSAKGGSGGSNSAGSGGNGNGGNSAGSSGNSSGGAGGGSSGSTAKGGSGGSSNGGAGGGSAGAAGSGSGGSSPAGGSGSGGSTGGGGSGSAGTSGACTNTDTSVINIDSSGYVCGNSLGIKGAWYCYTSDTSNACNKTGAIPWNSTSKGMCLTGSIDKNGTAVIGFKVNSGPPGSTGFNAWDASKIVGFAITFESGSSGKGSGGSVLYIEYPSTGTVLKNGDAPGVTVPGVAGTSVTYNALFSDTVLANDQTERSSLVKDLANLTDVKIAIPFDSQSRSYDFCITKVAPLTAAPGTVVPTGAYGPAWSNSLPQAVNGVNGYAVQSTPFDGNNGLPMTMQVSATSGGVGFTYTAKSGASGNTPISFPAVISGWGPGEGGDQLYGSYQADTTISSLQTVTSSWSFTPGSSGDAAYDVWFGPSKAPVDVPPAIELMIWINNGGKQPIGAGTAAGAAVVGSDGVSRKPYTGTNTTNQQVVSYVADTASATSVTNFDLLPYFKDAASKKYAGLQSTYYLLGVQTGFEVYSADTWKTTDYNITIK